MKEKISPPTNYFGGKYGTIGKFISELLPEHKYYIEPCGGMAGVLFHKKPSLVEVYNDIDGRIVNLFRVLRDKKKLKKLLELLRLTPYSRDEYVNSCKVLKDWISLDEIDLAYHSYIALSMAIQPSFRWNGFRQGGLNYETSVARSFKKRVELLNSTAERLKDVIIENLPANKLMLKFNRADVLVYLDPPYVHSTRFTVKDYGHEMDDLDHLQMISVVKNLKSKVLISGYDNELYNNELKDFERLEICSSSSIAASNGINCSSRKEVLWANFKLQKQIELF